MDFVPDVMTSLANIFLVFRLIIFRIKVYMMNDKPCNGVTRRTRSKKIRINNAVLATHWRAVFVGPGRNFKFLIARWASRNPGATRQLCRQIPLLLDCLATAARTISCVVMFGLKFLAAMFACLSVLPSLFFALVHKTIIMNLTEKVKRMFYL